MNEPLEQIPDSEIPEPLPVEVEVPIPEPVPVPEPPSGPSNNSGKLPSKPEILFTDVEKTVFADIQNQMAMLNNRATGAFSMLLGVRGLKVEEWTMSPDCSKAIKNRP